MSDLTNLNLEGKFFPYPDTKNTLIVLFGSSKKEKEELERKYKNAQIIEENELKSKKLIEKDFSTIFLKTNGKNQEEQAAKAISKLLNKNQGVHFKIEFTSPCFLTEEEKKQYVEKWKECLQKHGIKVLSASYENIKSESKAIKLSKKNTNQLNSLFQSRKQNLSEELNELRSKRLVNKLLKEKGQQNSAKFKMR